MQSEELRSLTGSELLTLEEEKDNQKSWRDDPNKCTFIITDLNNNMVGDVNLFVSRGENDKERLGELNVMIAEPNFRRKGCGTEAIAGMIWYSQQQLTINKFIAKVQIKNLASISLFSEKLGFKEVGRSEAFEEVTLEYSSEVSQKLEGLFKGAMPVVEAFPDPEIESLRLRGNQAFENRDFQRAIKFYDEAVTMDGKDEVLRGNRSAARLRAGEGFGALSDAAICLKLSPSYIKGSHRLGNAWAALGFEENAKAVYRDATKAFPEHQKTFEELMTKLAEESIARNSAKLTPIVIESFKLAPRAVDIEIEIELGEHKQSASAMRFATILMIWDKLTGPERLGVYEECVRTGYMGTFDAVPAADDLAKAKTPDFEQACAQADISPSIVKFVQDLGKNGPYERVAGLVLLFEGCSISQREAVANLLVVVIKSCDK